MSRIVKDLRARIFASTPRDRDAYHAEIEKHLARGMTVLDVGCGKGHLSPFPWNRHPDVRVVGIDPDPEAGVNDLAVCRYVVEHVEDPDQFTGDVRRVLRPGGRFIFLTPSRYHPVILASSMLPHGLHQAILSRTKQSADNDVFPTFYRMNSKRDLRTRAPARSATASRWSYSFSATSSPRTISTSTSFSSACTWVPTT